MRHQDDVLLLRQLLLLGNGVVTATIGDQKAECWLNEGHKADGAAFNRFGLLNVMKAADDGGEAWLGDLALKVWGQNWGDSIDDVKDGIVTVRQQIKGLADEELEGVTAKAFAIRDTFGVEIPESTNAANTLMQNFGLDELLNCVAQYVSSALQREAGAAS